jgi:hypothetical protein
MKLSMKNLTRKHQLIRNAPQQPKKELDVPGLLVRMGCVGSTADKNN